MGRGLSRRRGAFIKRNRHVLLACPATRFNPPKLLLFEWLSEIPTLRSAHDLREQFPDISDEMGVTTARKVLYA